MKLRTKLVWAGIVIVLIPMLFSAGVMGVLIERQNTQDAKQRSGKLLEVIHQELDRQATALVHQMGLFAQDSALFRNITFLRQSEDASSGTPNPLDEVYKTEIGLSLANFARINQYNLLMFFDNAHHLVAYTQFDEDHPPVLGIMTQDPPGTNVVKVIQKERVIMGSQDAQPDDWGLLNPVEITPIPIIFSEEITQSTGSIEVFANKVALKTVVPIWQNQGTSSVTLLGAIIGYHYLSQDSIARLSEQAQAQVNFFVGSALYAGTLPAFSEIPPSHSQELQQLTTITPKKPYCYTDLVIEEHPYYVAYYPLVQAQDGVIRSTLVLSVSKEPTYQKTRQAIILQSMVLILAGIIIIPVTLLLAGKLARPIQITAGISEAIANGHIDQHVEPLQSKDEIGNLSRSFHAMVTYLRDMAALAENISHGEITQEITPKTDHDILGRAYSRMTQYFKTIARAAERIQHGDLTKTIVVQSERDVLGITFNAMIQRLQDIVYQIRSRARELADASHHIATAADATSQNSETQAASVEMTSSAMQEMATNIAAIAQNLATQSSSVGRVKSATHQIAAASEEVVAEIGTLASLTQGTAFAIDQMGASLEDIHRQVQASVRESHHVLAVSHQGTAQVNRLSTEIQAINKQMEMASDAILRLQSQSQKIGEILDVIHNVVDQTNLLALNASIIAAQAGAHGRAFTVVAEEVKALANQTGRSVHEIAQFIQEIQATLTETVSAIRTSANSVMTGLTISEHTEQILQEIATGAEQSSQLITTTEQYVQQHTHASQSVRQAMTEVIRKLEGISTLTKNQYVQSANITEETEQLTLISEGIQGATEQQSAVAHQIVGTMTEMSSTVQQNADHAKQLAELSTDLAAQAHKFVELVEQFTVKKQPGEGESSRTA